MTDRDPIDVAREVEHAREIAARTLELNRDAGTVKIGRAVLADLLAGLASTARARAARTVEDQTLASIARAATTAIEIDQSLPYTQAIYPLVLAAVEKAANSPLARGYLGRLAGGVPTAREVEALAFCFRVALEHDHGGAKRIRRLLYAWHNAAELGGFDFADLWSFDEEYRGHALTLINMIARSPQGWYAEHYGYQCDMAAIVDTYGPAVQR